jgi:hypothetical protein
MAREGKSGKKYESAREMQNSSIAHIGIGSTLEDDNTTSTPPIFVVPSAILGVFDISLTGPTIKGV